MRALLLALLLAACGAPEDHSPVANPVGWFEIPVTDMGRAISFYEAVFGWTLEPQVVDGYEMAFLPGSEDGAGATGALARGDVYVPARSGPILYFRVPSIDETLKRATAAGATILYPKKAVPGVGFVAEFEDSEGNRIALTQPAPPR